MIRSYTTLQYSEAEKTSVFKIFAACLHCSNIHFEKVAKAMEEDGSKVANPECLGIVADQLGLDAAELEKAMTSKNVGNKSVIIVSYTPQQSSATRDSMAKAIYQGLFTWTIKKCNESMDKQPNFANFAAILDIFGFESFHHNSLEQLCINLCNEKLQYFFNDFIFAQEEAAYQAEGVSVPRSDFEDNGPTLELLEKSRTGVLARVGHGGLSRGELSRVCQECLTSEERCHSSRAGRSARLEEEARREILCSCDGVSNRSNHSKKGDVLVTPGGPQLPRSSR